MIQCNNGTFAKLIGNSCFSVCAHYLLSCSAWSFPTFPWVSVHVCQVHLSLLTCRLSSASSFTVCQVPTSLSVSVALCWAPSSSCTPHVLWSPGLDPALQIHQSKGASYLDLLAALCLSQEAAGILCTRSSCTRLLNRSGWC